MEAENGGILSKQEIKLRQIHNLKAIYLAQFEPHPI
jgi:hypothetical protein